MDKNYDEAYTKIKYKIIHFHYLPGAKVTESTFRKDLEMGRTPVREALIRIEREGLINVVPQSGTFITKINMNTATNGRFVRECIEPQIMLEAVMKITSQNYVNLSHNLAQQTEAITNRQPDLFFDLDQEFHREFYVAANKLEVWDWLQLNNMQLNRFRRLRLRVPNLKWETLSNQHVKILDTVRQRNVDELSFLLRNHLHLMLDEQESVIDQYQDYFEEPPTNN